MNLSLYFNQFYLQFKAYPFFIQVAVIMIILSVTLFLVGNTILLFERFASAYRTSKVKLATDLVSAELTGNLMMTDKVSERDFDTIANRLKGIALKSRLYNQVLIDQIIFYHRNFTDSTEKILGRLFTKLDLIQSAVKKLKNGSWETKAKGLKEMQEMTPKDQMNDLIDPLLNDKNDDLRIEAQSAYLRLNHKNPFGFLQNATEPLLHWHQILLYELITNSPDLAIPDLRIYLKSPNETVISFAVKLVQFYQQLEAIPDLIALISHPTENIRAEVIEVLGRLDAEDAEEVMIGRYANESLKVKIKIIQAVGEITSGHYVNFLKNEFLTSAEFAIIKTAGCALAAHPEFNKDSFLASSETNLERVTIMNHCTNVLIRN
ncbi:MAG: HEAT repeat domain-containing protein [Pedobacter sp.]|nr:MAG: HEAT repeat domain-containing protein [Pedobacter sp.]